MNKAGGYTLSLVKAPLISFERDTWQAACPNQATSFSFVTIWYEVPLGKMLLFKHLSVMHDALRRANLPYNR